MTDNEVIILNADRPLQDSDLNAITNAWQRGLIVLDNHSVNALAGNAYDEYMQSDIAQIKGGSRSATQPLGWAHRFEGEALDAMATAKLPDDAKQLIESKQLGELLGGLCFVRSPANLQAKEDYKIPDSIIPKANGDAVTVQIYDPSGVTSTAAIVEHAQQNGISTVMSSANKNSEPETINRKDGEAFLRHAQTLGITAVTGVFFDRAARATHAPKGSYPIIECNANGIELVRAGCIGLDILRRILHDYDVRLSAKCNSGNYPYDTLRVADLHSETASLTGKALREAILKDIGWNVS